MFEWMNTVCWDITSRCNDSCAFCYRDPDNQDLSLCDNKTMLAKLIELGVKKISFVGGEPLLYKDLFKLVEYGRCLNHHVVFSVTTNAIALVQDNAGSLSINEFLLLKILHYFDWITLSLEGSEQESQLLVGRNALHFDRVMAILQYIKSNHINSKVKINTMVNAQNTKSVLGMADLLLYYSVRRWKLMKFLPSRFQAKANFDQYAISDEQYFSLVALINRRVDGTSLKLTSDCNDDYTTSYINISSNGNLVLYDGEEYSKQLNLLHDSKSDIKKYFNDKKFKKRMDFMLIG